MASGSSGRGPSSGSKAFDFASDDILCSYEDYGNQDGSNGFADSSMAHDSSKEFHKNRMARSSVFPAATYSPPEESSFNQGVISTVENTVKKYTDNLMRFLEGISSRLSQLELYCYNLDKSIGEMRSDLICDHGESELKLKTLEKHIQEVHRSVQILRDKQELADTQKELAKLQLAQKETSSANSQQKEDKASIPASEANKSDSSSESHDLKLARALPHQVAPPSSLPSRPLDLQQLPLAPSSNTHAQGVSQVPSYYLTPSQMSNMMAPSQPSQAQYPPTQSQAQYPPTQSQAQELSRIAHQMAQSQVNQSQQGRALPPYQQQWPQQLQQPAQPPEQQVMQPQIRTSSQLVYSSYLPGQSNQTPAEVAPSSMPMQMSYAGASQPGSAGTDTMPYGYGSTGRPIPQQPPTQHLKGGYVAQSGDGYVPSGPLPSLPPGNTYMIYDEGGRETNHPPSQPHYQQGAYPPSNFPLQNPQFMPSPNMPVPPSRRSHPYNELIEKLVGMGYRGNDVVGIIQRLEESGQPVDFNLVLDRLNGVPSGGSQRGWST